MSTAHPKITLLQQLDLTNLATAKDIIAEYRVWHYFNPRLPQIQGDYVGIEGFRDFFGKMAQTTSGSFKVNPISITPIGDELVITHVRNTMLLEGKPIEIDAVVVWRIVNGKITEAWDIPAVYS
ncbi:ester cyclase [Flavobacteriaceae bacterium TP-CH-4]|uniref:Ester cyclase n=1 Tax=Pelagihabitans pacificus TaxID=2696054 RepID=A0A967ASY6_9FLAO|nr:nuclear transport factor 2 family protein [Pelagihabitans pacificus]NHF59693.1 ester cyclase [Pelagihabitans pacificus]